MTTLDKVRTLPSGGRPCTNASGDPVGHDDNLIDKGDDLLQNGSVKGKRSSRKSARAGPALDKARSAGEALEKRTLADVLAIANLFAPPPRHVPDSEIIRLRQLLSELNCESIQEKRCFCEAMNRLLSSCGLRLKVEGRLCYFNYTESIGGRYQYVRLSSPVRGCFARFGHHGSLEIVRYVSAAGGDAAVLTD